jgi:hypothetical protein
VKHAFGCDYSFLLEERSWIHVIPGTDPEGSPCSLWIG